MKSQRFSLGEDFLPSSMLLKGRRECQCEATAHKLINNCLNCGRIVCEQEGSGPCFTCNKLVCTNEEREILNRDSKSSAKLLQKLMGEGLPVKPSFQDPLKKTPELQKAIDHKNKLLEFNDTSEKRTRVIDDESDYFNMDKNKWLSNSVRKAFEEKIKEKEEARHGSRLNKKITFDFAGRVIEEDPDYYSFEAEELLKDDTSIFDHSDFISVDSLQDYKPEFKESASRTYVVKSIPGQKQFMRIQDKELQFMSDDGHCLSINQPYASLLISGIKKHEGRDWYTSYRGRLWIHASQKTPTKENIIETENYYRLLLGDHTKFPTKYPTGVVVGCVDLIECLTQEEYREKYKDGEIASPFVFICDNSQELRIQLPMKGGRRIFKMDSHFHNAAKKTLQKT